MIKIRLSVSADFFTCEAVGHALFSSKGKDLVCCAVSTLIQAWVLSCEQLTPVTPEVEKKEGYLFAKVDKSTDTNLLFRSLCLNLSVLEKQYKSYLEITLEEQNGS